MLIGSKNQNNKFDYYLITKSNNVLLNNELLDLNNIIINRSFVYTQLVTRKSKNTDNIFKYIICILDTDNIIHIIEWNNQISWYKKMEIDVCFIEQIYVSRNIHHLVKYDIILIQFNKNSNKLTLVKYVDVLNMGNMTCPNQTTNIYGVKYYSPNIMDFGYIILGSSMSGSNIINIRKYKYDIYTGPNYSVNKLNIITNINKYFKKFINMDNIVFVYKSGKIMALQHDLIFRYKLDQSIDNYIDNITNITHLYKKQELIIKYNNGQITRWTITKQKQGKFVVVKKSDDICTINKKLVIANINDNQYYVTNDTLYDEFGNIQISGLNIAIINNINI